MGSFFLSRPKNRQKPARPASPRAHRPHPGRNLGLGRQSAAARSPAWAKLWSGHLQPFDQDRRLVRASWEIKTRRGLCTETLESFRFLRFSLYALSLLSAVSTERRPSGRWSEAWRRRRPPHRRACSPTGEHAAVERPGRGALLLPRRRRVFPTPGEVFPFPLSLSPFPSPSSLLFGSCFLFSEPKEGIRVWISFIPFLSFDSTDSVFLFGVHPNRDLGLVI